MEQQSQNQFFGQSGWQSDFFLVKLTATGCSLVGDSAPVCWGVMLPMGPIYVIEVLVM